MLPIAAVASLDRQPQFNKKTRKSRKFMLENLLPAHLIKRIEDLQGREVSYIEDELFSEEALTNLACSYNHEFVEMQEDMKHILPGGAQYFYNREV